MVALWIYAHERGVVEVVQHKSKCQRNFPDQLDLLSDLFGGDLTIY